MKERREGERGLPKRRVAGARITPQGVEGDYNVYRQEKLDGDPDSAVLIIPHETLTELNEEGWPVEPGHLGENLTTGNIDYAEFQPQRRLRIGKETVLQISRACDPCSNLEQLPYVGTERKKEFIQTLLGRRGWYARVLEGGAVSEGDKIQLL